MSTHDEESTPLEETQASGEPGEAGAGEAPGAAAAANEPLSISHEVEQGLLRARAALERKDWQDLADYVGLDSIAIEGHPEPVSQIVAKLNALTASLCDFEGVILRVGKHETDADRARFSFRFRIMWNSCDDWEDHDLYVDAHLGYTRDAGGWKVSYLSASRARPQEERETAKESPKPAETETAKTPAATVIPAKPASPPPPQRPRRAAAAKAPERLPAPPPPAYEPKPIPKAADTPLTDEYFSQAAAQYFAQFATPEKPEGAAPKQSLAIGSSVGGKHHLLYVPVVMHEDLIKKILGND